MKIKVLELFAGIGACSKALERLGIEHEIVDAVEIDKYAMKSFNAIHGTNFEPQDITTWDKNIEVDLIMHGSPCQDFSLAGKQAGGDKDSGTRSSLMYETIRIVEKLRPKYVVWENVKNLLSKKHRHNFDAYLETMESLGYVNYYQVLNAKDYGIPQNRERVFTISIYQKPIIKVIGNYMPSNHDASRIVDINGIAPTVKENHGTITAIGEIEQFIFPPKQDLKLKLKDMLEDEVDEKYYISDGQLNNIISKNQAGYLSGGKWDKINESCRRYYKEEGISPTLDTMQGGWIQPCIEIKEEPEKIELMTIQVPQIIRVRKYPVNIEGLKETLRTAKADSKLSNKDIAEKLSVPMTKVEHWFRTDNCFAIPDENLWFSLKDLLNIETYEFDKSIMTFEEREGVYEKGNRYYDENGLAPTVMSSSNGEKILTNTDIKAGGGGNVPLVPIEEPHLNIKNNTKQGYLEAYEGDGVDISSRMKYHRGTVQKETIQTLDCQGGNSKGVVVPCETRYDEGIRFFKDDSMGSLRTNNSCGNKSILSFNENNDLRIRKLTPKECWRLMGFDDSDFEKAEKVNSNTQLYKQAGNSIVVNVLETILKELLINEK